MGCACRGNAGFAHPACIEKSAKINIKSYYECGICGQEFTGRMQTELANRWYDATRNLPKSDGRRIMAGSNKADALFANGKYDEALELYTETLNALPKGKETRGTLQERTNIANVVLRKRDYASAIEMFREIRSARIKLFGENDYDTLSAGTNLANALNLAKEYSAGEKLLRDVLEKQERVFGKEHPNTLRTAMNIGYAMRQQNKFPGAEKLLRDTLTVQTRVLGPEHPDTLTTVRNLALACRATGEYAEAKTLLTKTHAIENRLHGSEHPSTLHCTALLDSLPDLQTKGTGRLMDMCC